MSSRLFTEVREKRGLCYTVYASLPHAARSGSVLCYAGTTAERAQETLDVTLGELVRLASGIEPRELDRLKARIKSGLIMQQESSSARSGRRSPAIGITWAACARSTKSGRLVDDAVRCRASTHILAEHPPRDFTVVTLGPRTAGGAALEFRKHTLDNGLEIVAECNDEAHSHGVGLLRAHRLARRRRRRVAGVSHFLEHMVFKGTPRARPTT